GLSVLGAASVRPYEAVLADVDPRRAGRQKLPERDVRRVPAAQRARLQSFEVALREEDLQVRLLRKAHQCGSQRLSRNVVGPLRRRLARALAERLRERWARQCKSRNGCERRSQQRTHALAARARRQLRHRLPPILAALSLVGFGVRDARVSAIDRKSVV